MQSTSAHSTGFFKKGLLCAVLLLGSLAHLDFLSKLDHLSIPNWRQRKRETVLFGLYAGLILRRRRSDIISRLIDAGNISPRHLYAILTIVWYYTWYIYIYIIFIIVIQTHYKHYHLKVAVHRSTGRCDMVAWCCDPLRSTQIHAEDANQRAANQAWHKTKAKGKKEKIYWYCNIFDKIR